MLCCGIVRLVVAEHFTPFSFWRGVADGDFPFNFCKLFVIRVLAVTLTPKLSFLIEPHSIQ